MTGRKFQRIEPADRDAAVAQLCPRLADEPPTMHQIRRWARAAGLPCSPRGRIAAETIAAYLAAHTSEDQP